MTSREPEDRQSAEGDRADLNRDEREWRRQDDPERGEQREDRVDVTAEANDLLAGRTMRDLERPTLAVLQTACTMFPRS